MTSDYSVDLPKLEKSKEKEKLVDIFDLIWWSRRQVFFFLNVKFVAKILKRYY